MSGEIASTRLGRATVAVCALALALLGQTSAVVADGPGGSTWFGTPMNIFTGAATGYESVWFRTAYAATQRDGFYLPPLVTTNPQGTPPLESGALDNPSTTVLAGSLRAGDHWRSGVMLEAGYWLNPCAGTALVADYISGGRDSYEFSAGREDQILAQPFFDTEVDDQSATLVNYPGDRIGSVTIAAYDDFQSAGGALQMHLWSAGNPWASDDSAQVSIFGGYRYYEHRSVVLSNLDFTFLENNVANITPGAHGTIHNKFAARNQFHGVELGVTGRMQHDIWWLDGLAGLALGGNRQFAFIDGGFVDTDGTQFTNGGGLISGITNYGRFKTNDVQVIPRFRVGAGCQLTEHFSARVGYNLIVWDGVVQAADTLPAGLAVDPRNLPTIVPGGGAEPIFPGLHKSTTISHGIDVGLEFWF